MKVLLFLLMASGAAAQSPVGCTPLPAAVLSAEEFARDYRPLAKGDGATVRARAKGPGVTWDLGEKRTARLSVYLTLECALGLTAGVTGGFENSAPNPQDAVDALAKQLLALAPDWTFSVEEPSTMRLSKDGVEHATDLPKLLQLRLDAATPVDLGGTRVRVIFDGWMLFVVPADASKSLNLSVRSTVYPWALYDLTPYGLPRLLVRFDEQKSAALYPLP
jgi:hypothetical protein